tara:strand:+ start:2258 stop:2542 length:285 start_codon:yes stop_codon:yes gene_type:complete
MKRICLIVLGITFYTSFLQAADSKFKFIFGSNLGEIPFEINKSSQNINTLPGIKLNSWVLSPKYSSFIGAKESFNFSEDRISKDKIYIKLNIRF